MGLLQQTPLQPWAGGGGRGGPAAPGPGVEIEVPLQPWGGDGDRGSPAALGWGWRLGHPCSPGLGVEIGAALQPWGGGRGWAPLQPCLWSPASPSPASPCVQPPLLCLLRTARHRLQGPPSVRDDLILRSSTQSHLHRPRFPIRSQSQVARVGGGRDSAQRPATSQGSCVPLRDTEPHPHPSTRLQEVRDAHRLLPAPKDLRGCQGLLLLVHTSGRIPEPPRAAPDGPCSRAAPSAQASPPS